MNICKICGSHCRHAGTSGFGHTISICCNKSFNHMFVENPTKCMGICHQAKALATIAAEQKSHLAKFRDRNCRLIHDLILRGYIGKSSTVLDYGSGFGGISLSLKAQLSDTRLLAVEMCDEQRTLLLSQGINVFESIEDIPIRAFDFIFMVEVLEHLEDPVQQLTALGNRLSENGSILITTPVGRLMDGELGSGFETASHVQFFSESSLTNCLVNSGFRKPRFEYPPSLYPNSEIVNAWVPFIAEKGHVHLVTFAELQ